MHYTGLTLSVFALFAPNAPESEALAAVEALAPVCGTVEPCETMVESVEFQQVERGRFALTARFPLPESGASGELRVDLWNGVEQPIAEANGSRLPLVPPSGCKAGQMPRARGVELRRVDLGPGAPAPPLSAHLARKPFALSAG